MNSINPSLQVYNVENLLAQAANAKEQLGYKLVYFFVDEKGLLAKIPTERVATFYLSASGGTLRDSDLNIVLYSAKFDLYKGYGKA